jgi:flagellar hook-associated protein 3 FlgL
MINATGNRMTQEIQRQSRLAQRIAVTQTQISTGKRIQRPSDNPVGAARAATLRQVQADDAARAGNISLGISLTAQADGIMRSVANLTIRAQELTIAGANSSMPAADRAVIAAELTAIADEIDVQAQSRSITGQALFSTGTASAIRFDRDIAFAPVPPRAQLFDDRGIAISQTIRDAAAAITNGNSATIATSLTTVASAVDHVASSSAAIGLNAAKLDRLQDNQALRAITIAEERSSIEDTDISAAIAELNAQTLTLEAAQAAFARINRRTLMDFLS